MDDIAKLTGSKDINFQGQKLMKEHAYFGRLPMKIAVE
jgi:hypothetical protein